jgi:transposase InsO family protein
MWLTDRKTMANGSTFLQKVINFYPFKIHCILTNNGPEFTYKALAIKTREIHLLDQVCNKNKIEHRTIKFRYPWTNGMVERFNGKIETIRLSNTIRIFKNKKILYTTYRNLTTIYSVGTSNFGQPWE